MVKKLKGRTQICLSTSIMSQKLLFYVDPCALLITAGCFASAGKHKSEVLARGCCVRIVQPKTANSPAVKIRFYNVSVN